MLGALSSVCAWEVAQTLRNRERLASSTPYHRHHSARRKKDLYKLLGMLKDKTQELQTSREAMLGASYAGLQWELP